jgi:hypothetical protein
MSTVSVYSYTHSVRYVADNILTSLKNILLLSGLNPAKFVEGRESNLRALTAWMESGHLRSVKLEIIDPKTDKLVFRWDLEIVYSWSSGDGTFWTDTAQLRYAIAKEGLVPSECSYSLLLTVAPGAPDVSGWGDATGHSTAGMVPQSLGTTIEHQGLGANATYWRKAG